jgi:tetratricopeptide (TPR) repeat protein
MHFRRCQHIFYPVLWGVLWTVPLWANPSLVNQAMVAFGREEFSEARAYIDRALEDTPNQDRGGSWYYRGVIYEKLLRDQIATEEATQFFEETLTAYCKVLVLTPVASQWHSFAQINLNGLWAYYLDRGRRYYKQEAFESAIQQFKCCQQIMPSNPYAYLYTAIAAHQGEEHDLALHNYTYYLESGVVAPVVVYHGLVHLTAYSLKDPTKALGILEAALLQYPFDNDLLYEQIQLYTVLGQFEVKQKLVKKQVTLTPCEAAPHYQLGYLYEQQGQWQQALKQYQKAAELAPNRVEPVLQQGIVHYNQAAQSDQEITEMAEEKFQQGGTKRIEKLENCLEQAKFCFEQANKLSPQDPFILKHLQRIYRHLREPVQLKKIERRLRKYKL